MQCFFSLGHLSFPYQLLLTLLVITTWLGGGVLFPDGVKQAFEPFDLWNY